MPRMSRKAPVVKMYVKNACEKTFGSYYNFSPWRGSMADAMAAPRWLSIRLPVAGAYR